MSLIIDLGGVPGQERLGFRYWKNGNAFLPYKSAVLGQGGVAKFAGFVNALVLALFAYMGTELIGVTVGEAKNPRKTVPSAIKKTFYRILFFYIILILLVGMIVDPKGPELAAANKKGTAGGASASPFVVAIKAAHIKVLPSILNACILLFTFSAANSDQYIASRTLYGMAKDGNAPRIFTKCTKRGVPWVAFIFTACFMSLAFLVASSNALDVFYYFTSSVTICGALSWISILSSHIAMMRGMKAQGISRDTLPYKAPFQPYLSYFALAFTCLLTFFKGFDSFIHSPGLPPPNNKFDYKSFITHCKSHRCCVIVFVANPQTSPCPSTSLATLATRLSARPRPSRWTRWISTQARASLTTLLLTTTRRPTTPACHSGARSSGSSPTGKRDGQSFVYKWKSSFVVGNVYLVCS